MQDEFWNFIKNEPNRPMEFVKKFRIMKTGGVELLLYGGGAHLQHVIRFMEKYHLPVSKILDTYERGQYKDIPILRYEDFVKDVPKLDSFVIVISAVSRSQEIMKMLCKRVPLGNIFVFAVELLEHGLIPDIDKYRSYLLANKSKFQEFSDTLADVYSKRTLELVLQGRISGECKYFDLCYCENQYYPRDIIRFTDHEVMVELGAYDGGTLQEFISRVPNYDAIYTFEPEEKLLRHLEEIASRQHELGRKCCIIPKGAWNENCIKDFFITEDMQGNTVAIDKGTEVTDSYKIEMTTVDDTVREPITYMKLDIEGAEMRALHGAEKQIQANKPKLAVSVYHRVEDILEIWQYLHSLVPEYRFYLRHHGFMEGTDTVLYAVI